MPLARPVLRRQPSSQRHRADVIGQVPGRASRECQRLARWFVTLVATAGPPPDRPLPVHQADKAAWTAYAPHAVAPNDSRRPHPAVTASVSHHRASRWHSGGVEGRQVATSVSHHRASRWHSCGVATDHRRRAVGSYFLRHRQRQQRSAGAAFLAPRHRWPRASGAMADHYRPRCLLGPRALPPVPGRRGNAARPTVAAF